MGITRIANVTGLDRIGIPVVMVCRPNSRSLAVSQGKGLTLEAAKASGVMEAIELYHAERIELPLKLGSARELARTHRLVDLDALPRLAGSSFHPDLPILWIEGRNLLTDLPAWLPYEVVHTRYTLPLPSGSGCFPASSNGLASGNHLLEAINHGIAEVVERDSTTLWNHLDKAARARTRIDLSTIDDEDCALVLAQLERAEFAVAVWDVTTDVGIAAFYCLITDRRARACPLRRRRRVPSRARGRAAAGVDRGDPGAHHLHHRLARRPAAGRVHAPGDRAEAAPRAGADERGRSRGATFAMCRPSTRAPAPRTSPGCWTACAPSASRRSWRST